MGEHPVIVANHPPRETKVSPVNAADGVRTGSAAGESRASASPTAINGKKRAKDAAAWEVGGANDLHLAGEPRAVLQWDYSTRGGHRVDPVLVE